MDQKLLLVVLSIVKLDTGAIAAKWLEENGELDLRRSYFD